MPQAHYASLTSSYRRSIAIASYALVGARFVSSIANKMPLWQTGALVLGSLFCAALVVLIITAANEGELEVEAEICRVFKGKARANFKKEKKN